MDAFEEIGYGETGSLDGSSSIQETKNFVGWWLWWLCLGVPGVEILH